MSFIKNPAKQEIISKFSDTTAKSFNLNSMKIVNKQCVALSDLRYIKAQHPPIIRMDEIFYDEQEQAHHQPHLTLDLNISDMFPQQVIPPPSPKKEEPADEPQSRLREQFSVNSNNKNKYINRISAISKDGKITEALKNKGGPRTLPKNNPSSQGDESEPTTRNMCKLEKNRQSARLSRERKKFYMEMLETKVEELEKEISKTKEELNSTTNYLQKVVAQNETMSSFAVGRQQTMKRLEKLIEDQANADVNEINAILDSIRSKIGATGRERVNTINEYFKQIVNISFPALHRYMMWTASERKHLFSQGAVNQQDEWFRQLDQKLGLTQQQKREILARRDQFEDQKNALLSLIDNLHDTKKKIQLKSEQLESEIDKIRSILTPVQSAKFILFIEKNKYRKELNIWDKKTQKDKSSQEATGDVPSKKMKM